MELTDADAGREHTAAVGEQLVVRLPESPTTGYRWQLEVPPEVTVEEDGFEPGDPGAPGAAGTRTFRLRATAPGTHHLAASQRRSWETGPGTGRGVEFTVRVS